MKRALCICEAESPEREEAYLQLGNDEEHIFAKKNKDSFHIAKAPYMNSALF